MSWFERNGTRHVWIVCLVGLWIYSWSPLVFGEETKTTTSKTSETLKKKVDAAKAVITSSKRSVNTKKKELAKKIDTAKSSRDKLKEDAKKQAKDLAEKVKVQGQGVKKDVKDMLKSSKSSTKKAGERVTNTTSLSKSKSMPSGALKSKAKKASVSKSKASTSNTKKKKALKRRVRNRRVKASVSNKKKPKRKQIPQGKKRKGKGSWVPQVNVVGKRPSELDSVPGAAAVMGKEELKSRVPLNVSEALQTMPGVNVSDEDGMGLRLNIGLRGLDPVRSRKILVLEDGVPVSMAPYGEPEMYYTPRIERMVRLEIVKGSGSILWGPQTIGGVLNFITRAPPKKLQVRGELRYGSYDYFQAQASVGDTIGKFGYLVEAIHHRYVGPRNLNLVATDVSSKMVFRITSTNVLGIKLHFYREDSHATYLGLTSPQFLRDPFANHAIHDRFPIQRVALAMNHKVLLGETGILQTRLYAHTITRFWQRQDYARSGSGSNFERKIDSANKENENPVNDGGAIYFKRSTGNRNRAFAVAGLESRYTLEYSLGSTVESELIAGARFHYERGDEMYLIGENEKSPTGFIRDMEDRTTLAMALYLQNSFSFLDRKLVVTPGFRFESMWIFRHLARTRVKQPDGSRKAMDTDIQENSTMFAPIPGIGISYKLRQGLHLFAGVHRGFAPPRTKDSITADGDDLELDPEFSWNYELGMRFRLQNFLYMEFAGFLMDFQNQVIPPSESSGAVASDPGNLGKSRVNAGRTLHAGGELSFTFDLPAMLKSGFRLPLTLSYTWVPVARFMDGRYDGNRLPYAPEHLLTTTLRFEHPIGFSASVAGNLVSSQTSDKGETITPTVNGLVGLIPARFLLNARVAYTFRWDGHRVGVFVAGKNLTNTIYIVSRRPQGIRAGIPLQIFGGLQGAW